MADDADLRDCVIFSTAEWDAPYWTNSQHMARALAKRGHRVLFVETVGVRAPRLGSPRDMRRLWRRLRRGIRDWVAGARLAEPGIRVMSPLTVPLGQRSAAVAALNRLILRSGLRRFRGGAPLVWTYHPYMLGVADALEPIRLIYHCVDDIGAIPGVDAAAFREAERQLATRASTIFVTTRALEARLKALNPNTHYLSNVVDFDHFRVETESPPLPADLRAIPEPRLGYHGVLSGFKVDFALLLTLAQAHPDWNLVLIGEERVGQRSPDLLGLLALPNVHHLGYRSYKAMPGYLHGFTVGLLPSRLNGYTASMFPMKYFEYLAAGAPVVATPLDFTREASFVEVGDGPEAFAAAIRRQLARGRLSAAESREAVGDQTWDRRLARMMALLQGAHG